MSLIFIDTIDNLHKIFSKFLIFILAFPKNWCSDISVRMVTAYLYVVFKQ